MVASFFGEDSVAIPKALPVQANCYRPHMTLNGRTLVEVFEDRAPANEKPRIEPRPKWPQESLCASPQADVEGAPGAKPVLEVAFLEGRKHLPIVRLKNAA